jgi:hypothetical protein
MEKIEYDKENNCTLNEVISFKDFIFELKEKGNMQAKIQDSVLAEFSSSPIVNTSKLLILIKDCTAIRQREQQKL